MKNKPLKVIIEGGDGTGKSTLIRKLLCSFDNVNTLHLSYRDATSREFYSNLLDINRIIFDRQFLSEIVYSTVFDRKCALSEEDINMLLKRCEELNVKILILDVPVETIKKRLAVRGEDEEAVLRNTLFIKNEFLRLAQKYNLPVINTEEVALTDIVNYIEGESNEKYKSYMFK